MLAVANLTYERYFQPVFRPVSFDLTAGKLLVITGANGSGKTTLIRVLAGILPLEWGSFESGAETTAYLGHQLAIKDDLSVIENIRFMQAFYTPQSTPDQSASPQSIAAEMGLDHVAGQPARSLSAGQRKRCALSRLRVVGADLWLLDEPYSNLDSDGISLVDAMIEEHTNGGGSCIMATHGTHRPAGLDARELCLQPGTAEAGE